MASLTLAACLLLPRLGSAGTATVAVMPFRDLAGGAGGRGVGEAVRETVTADLRALSGLKVLERDRIDQLVLEQHLGGKQSDLDTVSAVRLGTLLGATLIVAGAYQRAGSQIRLTARLIRVETGEILGSAKADGAATDVFAVQDRLTAPLLRSAGFEPPPKRTRPRLRRAESFELYGNAVVEKDPVKRHTLLSQVVAADPDFVYAKADLDALQARMAGYEKKAEVVWDKNERADLARLEKASKEERVRLAGELLGGMTNARRWHTEVKTAERLRADPSLAEISLYSLFVAKDRLRQADAALQLGEELLKRFPAGPHYREVESRMHQIAEQKKKRASRRAEYDGDLREKLQSAKPGSLEHDWAPCIAARWNNQLNELMLDGCQAYLQKRASDPSPEAREHTVAARFFVVLALAERGDFARAKPLAEQILAQPDPGEFAEEIRTLLQTFPVD